MLMQQELLKREINPFDIDVQLSMYAFYFILLPTLLTAFHICTFELSTPNATSNSRKSPQMTEQSLR